LTVERKGDREVVLRTEFELPFCIDWLPDRSLLIVLGPQGRLVRREADGSLVTYADLRPVSENVWNEIVVDGRGNVYVDGGPGVIAVVTSDRSVRQVADGVAVGLNSCTFGLSTNRPSESILLMIRSAH
jgi:sugar lactone lactonase YvrE